MRDLLPYLLIEITTGKLLGCIGQFDRPGMRSASYKFTVGEWTPSMEWWIRTFGNMICWAGSSELMEGYCKRYSWFSQEHLWEDSPYITSGELVNMQDPSPQGYRNYADTPLLRTVGSHHVWPMRSVYVVCGNTWVLWVVSALLLTTGQLLSFHGRYRLLLQRLGVGTFCLPDRYILCFDPTQHPQKITVTQKILRLKFTINEQRNQSGNTCHGFQGYHFIPSKPGECRW